MSWLDNGGTVTQGLKTSPEEKLNALSSPLTPSIAEGTASHNKTALLHP